MPRPRRCRSFDFNPEDFLCDPHVIVMNLETRGAYITLLCRAWTMEVPGVLPADEEAIRWLVGATPEEWQRIGPKLKACFDTSGGRWIQKRMRREYEAQTQRIERRALAGRLGGEAKAKRFNKVSSNANSNAVAMLCPPSLLPPESKTESKTLTAASLFAPLTASRSVSRPPRKPQDEPEGFPAWYAVYPRRVARGAARAAYGKALAKATAEALLAGAQRYADWLSATGTPPDKTKHPATWLNQECWLDELKLTNRPKLDVWAQAGFREHA